MFTVAELLEALTKCPKDATVVIITPDGTRHTFETLGIDFGNNTVDLFMD